MSCSLGWGNFYRDFVVLGERVFILSYLVFRVKFTFKYKLDWDFGSKRLVLMVLIEIEILFLVFRYFLNWYFGLCFSFY